MGAGALWAANGGTRVAFVDLYDNLMAHPDPSLAGFTTYWLWLKNQALSVLEGENFTVDTFADIPANLSQYSLLYLQAYFASPANEPAIQNYIANGGGVVISSGAICYLVYYSNTLYTGQDLSSVADWFGASYYTNAGGSAHVTVADPLGTSLNIGDTLVTGVGYSCAAITSMSANSQVLATWDDGSTFAFTHTYDQGRVYWQATQNSENASTQSPPNPPPTPNPPPPNLPTPQQAEVYFSVEPVAVAPLINVNSSINGLEVPSSPSAVGQNFTVEIHLRNATEANVPAGVSGVEVHFDFGNIVNYCMPIGFTTMLGQSGGALSGPLIYGIAGGFYDANGNTVETANYAQATQYEVAAASPVGWNNDDGLVAQITFMITGQPSQALNQSTFYTQLHITYAELVDNNQQEIPFSIVQGTLKIDDPPTILGDTNGDGKVNLVDLVIFAKAYGSKPGDPNWNPAADILGHGNVDLADLVALELHYGQHYP